MLSAIDPNEVFWSRDPAIIRWFIANGMDLESGEWIAKAFRDKQWEFLGIYIDLRQPDTLRTKAGRHGASDLEFLRPRPFGTCLQLALLV